jgi:hypothetical protein
VSVGRFCVGKSPPPPSKPRVRVNRCASCLALGNSQPSLTVDAGPPAPLNRIGERMDEDSALQDTPVRRCRQGFRKSVWFGPPGSVEPWFSPYYCGQPHTVHCLVGCQVRCAAHGTFPSCLAGGVGQVVSALPVEKTGGPATAGVFFGTALAAAGAGRRRNMGLAPSRIRQIPSETVATLVPVLFQHAVRRAGQRSRRIASSGGRLTLRAR